MRKLLVLLSRHDYDPDLEFVGTSWPNTLQDVSLTVDDVSKFPRLPSSVKIASLNLLKSHPQGEGLKEVCISDLLSTENLEKLNISADSLSVSLDGFHAPKLSFLKVIADRVSGVPQAPSLTHLFVKAKEFSNFQSSAHTLTLDLSIRFFDYSSGKIHKVCLDEIVLPGVHDLTFKGFPAQFSGSLKRVDTLSRVTFETVFKDAERYMPWNERSNAKLKVEIEKTLNPPLDVQTPNSVEFIAPPCKETAKSLAANSSWGM